MKLKLSLILPVAFVYANAFIFAICFANMNFDEANSDHLGPTSTVEADDNSVHALNETLQEFHNQTESALLENDQNSTSLSFGESSENQTLVSATEPKARPKLNCTALYRDDSNMTSQLILVNVSTITRYLQLKMGPSLDLGSSGPAANQSSDDIGANKKQLSKSLPGPCTVLIFYLDWCPFSAAAASHFNALGRLFPQMNILAIDAYSLYSTTMRYGVMGVPSMYVFHRNKIVSKYNRSEANIDSFVNYINQITTFSPVGAVNLTESDLIGPLSSEVTYTFNYVFFGSWAFCIIVALYYFVRSDLFRRMKEHAYNMWNEAQFQHEHID